MKKITSYLVKTTCHSRQIILVSNAPQSPPSHVIYTSLLEDPNGRAVCIIVVKQFSVSINHSWLSGKTPYLISISYFVTMP
jgi:hypothetical protein